MDVSEDVIELDRINAKEDIEREEYIMINFETKDIVPYFYQTDIIPILDILKEIFNYFTTHDAYYY